MQSPIKDTKITVATPSAKSKTMCGDTAMVRALMGGTTAMREAGERLMPKWPNEASDTHKQRLATATLFPAYSRTVETLAAKPFSKPIEYGDNVPAQLRQWMKDDADLEGRNLDAFAAGVLASALAYGMAGILTDYPTVEPGAVRTVAQERAAGLRPYLIHVEPWNVLGWKSQRVNGVTVLTQLRLLEVATEPDGEFGEKEVEQVRLLEPGFWQTHRKNDEGEWVVYEQGTTTLGVIPFVPVYAQRAGFMQAKPPMLEVAHLNVKHWQSQSDQDHILHVARVPILAAFGLDDSSQLVVGASHAVSLPLGAGLAYVEHTGSSVSAGRTSLEDLKEEMRQAGAELLVLQPGSITATQVRTENSVGMCALQRIANGAEDAIDQALQFAAQWIGLPEGGNVTLFKDFGAATLAEASAALLVGMQAQGLLSKRTTLAEVRRRGILTADLDLDAELAAAAEDGPALGGMSEPGGEEE